MYIICAYIFVWMSMFLKLLLSVIYHCTNDIRFNYLTFYLMVQVFLPVIFCKTTTENELEGGRGSKGQSCFWKERKLRLPTLGQRAEWGKEVVWEALEREVMILGSQKRGALAPHFDQPRDPCDAGFSRSANGQLVAVLSSRWGNTESIPVQLGQIVADWIILAPRSADPRQGEGSSQSTFLITSYGLGIQRKRRYTPVLAEYIS